MKEAVIKGKVWRWEGPAGWYFVYVNEKLSRQIKDSHTSKGKGFGFVRIRATIGKTSWNTTLFPSKEGPYLLAIKADVRKKEGIEEGDSVSIKIKI